MTGEISRLLSLAFSQNSYKTYATGWNMFCQFAMHKAEGASLPVTPVIIHEFIAWLSIKGYASSTIATYVSGVGVYHRLHGHVDPTKDFLVLKLLEGCRRDRQSCDSREPITISTLTRILEALPHVTVSHFECVLFRASMLCAFFGFMRVSEFTADSKNRIQDSVLRMSDVTFRAVGDRCDSVLISFRASKNNQYGRAQVVRLVCANNKLICPVTALQEFVHVRPSGPGPLFCHFSGEPLTRYQFNAVLQKALIFCGIEGRRVRAHSFRIGAATVAHSLGVPISDIQRMGRWRSDAVLTYIRPEALCALPGISLG